MGSKLIVEDGQGGLDVLPVKESCEDIAIRYSAARRERPGFVTGSISVTSREG